MIYRKNKKRKAEKKKTFVFRYILISGLDETTIYLEIVARSIVSRLEFTSRSAKSIE